MLEAQPTTPLSDKRAPQRARSLRPVVSTRGRLTTLSLWWLSSVLTCVLWLAEPFRVLGRLLFSRSRRAPPSVADEVNQLAPQIVRTMEGKLSTFTRAAHSELLAEMLWSVLRIAVGKRSEVHVPSAVSERRFPSYYLTPFHSQPNGYLCPVAAALSDRLMAVRYGAGLEALYAEAAKAVGEDLRHGLVIDLGSGTGKLMRHLRTRHTRARLIGVELSPYMIACAYAQNLTDLDDNVEIIEGDATLLPFDDSSAKAVTACLALHQMPERAIRAALQEAFRVLAPGGRVVIADVIRPSASSARMRERLLSRVLHDPYAKRFVQLDLAAYLKKLGMREVAIREVAPALGVYVFEKPKLWN